MNGFSALTQRLTQPLDNKGVTLKHQRIFIVPSKGGLFFLAVLGVMLVAAVNYQNSLAYALCFWLASVGLISLFLTWRNLAGLQMQSLPVGGVFAGQSALYKIALRGHRLHYGVEFHVASQTHVVDVVRGAEELRFGLKTYQRGWLKAGRIKVQSLYPLGLFRAWSWVSPTEAVVVYPAPLEGPMPCAKTEHIGDLAASASAHGFADFQGLQMYRPGDSLSRIHWQSLGKGQSLQSKSFGIEGITEQQLDLNNAAGDWETRLSVGCYWVLALTQKATPFALTVGAVKIELGQGPEHSKRCLEALAHA